MTMWCVWLDGGLLLLCFEATARGNDKSRRCDTSQLLPFVFYFAAD
jgi:hypothetical protein